MQAVAFEKQQATTVVQTVGTVVAATRKTLRVRIDDEVVRARKAFSCLVQPEPGDHVIVAEPADGAPYVLAVLERPRASAVGITVDGDCSLKVRNGRFRVDAARGVDLVSRGEIAMDAPEFEVRAGTGRFLIESLTHFGRTVRTRLRRIDLVAGVMDACLERLTQRAQRSYRIVDETDCVRSGEMDYRARGNVNVRGRNALVTAEELVKMDGDQIHVG
jgi:hypothetical protein